MLPCILKGRFVLCGFLHRHERKVNCPLVAMDADKVNAAGNGSHDVRVRTAIRIPGCREHTPGGGLVYVERGFRRSAHEAHPGVLPQHRGGRDVAGCRQIRVYPDHCPAIENAAFLSSAVECN